MKKFVLKAGNGINDHLLSDFSEQKEFDNFDAANWAFVEEVKEMRKNYKSENDVDYPIEQVNEAEQVQVWVDLICDDYEPETILISEHFIME